MTAFLYLYKAESDTSELRYSLRSLRHAKAEEVWLVGDCPEWLTGVGHVPGGEPVVNKFGSLFADLLRACSHPDVPDEFVLMNDDYHLLSPFEPAIEHRGTLRGLIERSKRPGQFREAHGATLDWLIAQGYEDPLCYEMHRPLPIVKGAAREALERAARRNMDTPLHGRTIYGAIAALGGEQVRDRKVNRDTSDWRSLDLVSTADAAWPGTVGEWIRAQSPEPSRWER